MLLVHFSSTVLIVILEELVCTCRKPPHNGLLHIRIAAVSLLCRSDVYLSLLQEEIPGYLKGEQANVRMVYLVSVSSCSEVLHALHSGRCQTSGGEM
jgi:hypothetical protein